MQDKRDGNIRKPETAEYSATYGRRYMPGI